MEPKNLTPQHLSRVIGNRRFQAFAIACLILVALVCLQVNELNQNKPMCEIFSHCDLRANDIQQIQIALSQSGLGEFEIEDSHVLVPKTQQAAYLQAIAEHDAIPFELRDSDDAPLAINPFLSRSQQVAMERIRKKNSICKMVARLPFVDQAWFEMDQADSHSAFEKAKQSAVISIRTTNQAALTNQHVDTVKRMIDGAVAGLELDDIVVIDLTSGAAHQDNLDPSINRQVRSQQIAYEQRRFYENQIRNVLSEFPGIDVTVLVNVQSAADFEQTALAPPPLPPIAIQPAVSNQGAGANGFASINRETNQPTAPILVASHQTTSRVSDSFHKQISVSLDVPQSLVVDLFGIPSTDRINNERGNNRPISPSQLLQQNFNQLSTELIQKIRPLLPESAFRNRTTFPITVHLIRQPTASNAPWVAQVKQLATQHWPSATVLAIGLVLLSIVCRTPRPTAIDRHRSRLDATGHPSAPESVPDSAIANSNPETQLSELIDKDPDAAAKVLESWIRDAA